MILVSLTSFAKNTDGFCGKKMPIRGAPKSHAYPQPKKTHVPATLIECTKIGNPVTATDDEGAVYSLGGRSPLRWVQPLGNAKPDSHRMKERVETTTPMGPTWRPSPLAPAAPPWPPSPPARGGGGTTDEILQGKCFLQPFQNPRKIRREDPSSSQSRLLGILEPGGNHKKKLVKGRMGFR